MNKTSKFELYLSKMFSNIILENEIVATVIYNVGVVVSKFKSKMDKTLNNDI